MVEKKLICIFVSSTFTDMEVERDIINNMVLNQLRSDFANYNVDIHFTDLRWGINTTDANDPNKRNEKILKVCMSEIERCRPYFIGLLGKRYGWTPDEELLYSCFSKADIQQCKKLFSTDKISVTALEMYHALINSNLSLEKCFICCRKEAVYSDIPDSLREAFIETKHEQEIKNFHEHITSFFKEKENHIFNYGGKWSENHFIPDEYFYKTLYQALHDAIEKDLKRELSFENEIKRENYYQDLFIEHTANDTITRHKEIKQICSLFQQENTKRIVVHAQSGLGKSTLLCQLCNQLAKEEEVNVLFYSAAASMESSTMTNLLESLSCRLSEIMGIDFQMIDQKSENDFSYTDFKDYTSISFGEGYGENFNKERMSYEQLVLENFHKKVNSYFLFSKKPLVILIDAFDRFEYSSLLHSLTWLVSLPVYIVITTLSDVVKANKTFSKFYEIELPAFSKDEAIEYIVKNCNGKELHRNVIQAIIERKTTQGSNAFASPLWLKLVMHVLSSLDISDFQNIVQRDEKDNEERIYKYMIELIRQIPPLPGEALLFFIEKSDTYIGREFSTNVLQLLAFSEYGLREQDLESIMGDKWSNLDFAVLHRWIRPYLVIGNENQWQLAHQLFVNTIKERYASKNNGIYSELYKHCNKLPIDDVLRVKTGMLYAILASNHIFNAVFFYTYDCRLPEAIRQATNIIVRYIKENPGYMDEFLKMTGNMRLISHHMPERILYTLGNQLFKQGMFSQAKQVYLFFEPLLEQNMDMAHTAEYFLPMIFNRLEIIYRNEYDFEMANHYRQKFKYIREGYLQQKVNDKSRNSKQDISDEYVDIIYDLYEQSTRNGTPYTEALFDIKFQNDKWEKNWLDTLLHILGDMYASLSCTTSHPKYNLWKDELPNAIQRYKEVLPENQFDWQIKIYEHDQNFFHKYNTMLMFSEFLLKRIVGINRSFALHMQDNCLRLYRIVTKSQNNEYYLNECALGHCIAAGFYLEIGEIDKAVNTNYIALEYSLDALNMYPGSINIKKRFLFACHSLGNCLFSICRYEEALKQLIVYRDGIKEILEKDATQLTMYSSYINAITQVGCCYLYMHNYEMAIENFKALLALINNILPKAPKSIYGSWLQYLFNCKYYIARCFYESGDIEFGIELADTLYQELIRYGFDPDSEYEPMENVRELLEKWSVNNIDC